MELERKGLINDLKICLTAVGKGATNPNNYFCFLNDGDSSYIASSDSSLVILKKVDYKLPLVEVRGMELFNILRKIKGETIDITTDDKQMIIKDNESTTSILKKPEINPVYKNIKVPSEWTDVDEHFAEKVFMASDIVPAKSLLSPLFGYVFVSKNKVCGSNGFEIFYCKLDRTDTPKMFIPPIVANFIYDHKPSAVNVSSNILSFKCADDIILMSCTISRGERYPILVEEDDWSPEEREKRKEMTIEKLTSYRGDKLMLREYYPRIKEAIGRCSIFTANSRDKEKITFSIKDHKITISGSGTYGSHSCSIDVDQDVDFSFDVSPKALLSAMEETDEIYWDKRLLTIVGPVVDNGEPMYTHVIQLY